MPAIMKRLNAISRCQSLYRDERFGEVLLPSHHAIVFLICRKPGLSQEEIARELNLYKSSVTRKLAVLEQAGLVERSVSPEDKRRTVVNPTEKMKEILPTVREIARGWTEIISEGISEDELSVFESVLSRMEANARAAVAQREDK